MRAVLVRISACIFLRYGMKILSCNYFIIKKKSNGFSISSNFKQRSKVKVT